MNPLKEQIDHLNKHYKNKKSTDPQKQFFEFNPYLNVAIERTIIVEAKDYDDAIEQMKRHWQYIISKMGDTLGEYAEGDEQITDFQIPFNDEEHEGVYSKSISNLNLMKPKVWEPHSEDDPLSYIDWMLWSVPVGDKALNDGRLDIDPEMNAKLKHKWQDDSTKTYSYFNSKAKRQYKRMIKKEAI